MSKDILAPLTRFADFGSVVASWGTGRQAEIVARSWPDNHAAAAAAGQGGGAPGGSPRRRLGGRDGLHLLPGVAR